MKPENEKPFHTEWIERYLSGELQGEELEQFIHRLHSDGAFRQEVALQRSIIAQAEQVGREELQGQLKSLHRRFGFVKEEKKRLSVNYYAIAAAIVLLLVATFLFYFSYQPSRQAPTIAEVKEQNLPNKPVSIRLQVTGKDPAIGFSGTSSDSTTTILLYRAKSPAYQFDDTLRLYGTFAAEALTLQHNEATGQYTLVIDSVSYPLQRPSSKQALQRVP